MNKAAVLLEALPYMLRYRGAIFVIKYGGSFMDSPDPEVRRSVARDIVFLFAVGLKPVVVHGGGKAISRRLEAAGIGTAFVQGHRVTDERTAEIVDDVLSREINQEVVKMIEELGGAARGFSGRGVFHAEALTIRGEGAAPIDLGYVGRISGVKVDRVLECLRNGHIPVISPTATGPDERVYNCNADSAAAAVAVALRAKRLVFMSDVPGLLADPADAASLIEELTAGEAAKLRAKGVIDKGMIPKVEGALTAVDAGVDNVSFVDGRVPHAVLLEIFTDRGFGTMVRRG